MASEESRPERKEELKQLRNKLLQKIIDRENQRRAARGLATA
ncbi:MAG: hypothetical protein ACYC6Y_26950 [Thermoguttaceae bacterium]